MPVSANILLDDDGGGFNDSLGGVGDGWFFDQTPLDDAEFTAIVNSAENGTGAAFQASFVDVTTGNLNYNDFYRTIVHEIGHAMGLYLSTNTLLDRLYNMTIDIGDDPNSTVAADRLRTFNGSNGTVTFATNGGGHIYEGNINDAAAIVSHPNDLMNAGRTVPPPGGNPIPTTRQFISDLDVQLLDDAYNYTVALPRTLDSAHVTLDSQTGTLLVQGRTGGLSDTITITTEGANNEIIKVVVNQNTANEATERVQTAHVTQIIIAGNGGTDTITVASLLAAMRKDVQYVVSSNQDSAGAGTLGDGIVDLDVNVPGNQVALRSAIRDANGGAIARSIYVPRNNNYRLTIEGTGGDAQGDLDITNNVTIIGTGAGEAIIDASGLVTTTDRVFDVASGGTLNLSRVTLTGGKARNASNENGGAIAVRGTLHLSESALVGNETTMTGSDGGAIYFWPAGGGSITNSVITANHAVDMTGGIHLASNPPNGTVTLTGTIVANNTDGNTSAGNDVHGNGTRVFTNGGSNRLTSGGQGFTAVSSDYIGAVDYVVTGLGDTYDGTTDKVKMSTRDAIHQANIIAGAQEIWLPAWKFMLTRERTALPTADEMDVAQGDLEVKQSLTIRGVNGLTSVAWRAGSAADKVFELLGDYNNDGVADQSPSDVDSSDYVIWAKRLPGADGNDDGVVDQDDHTVWTQHFGNTLMLWGVA